MTNYTIHKECATSIYHNYLFIIPKYREKLRFFSRATDYLVLFLNGFIKK